MAASEKQEPCRLKFGVVADVQYADADDGWDFHRTRMRRYRAAAVALRRALEHFGGDQDVAFVAQLGDLIDGKAKATGMRDWTDTIAPCFADNGFEADTPGKRDVHHCMGNHELYTFTREQLAATLKMRRGYFRDAPQFYYSFRPAGSGLRFVVLDPYDRSTLNGVEEQTRDCIAWLRQHNPNDVTSYQVDWVAGLSGTNRRWLPYNGAVSDTQLEFLEQELLAARQAQERVILLSHVSVCPGAQRSDETLLWNYDRVLTLLHQQPRGLVAACLYGHAHKGGYIQDAHGIHHRTFQAILETTSNAYGVVECYDDRLELRGFGDVESATFSLPVCNF